MPIVTGGFGNVCSDGMWVTQVCSCIHKARLAEAFAMTELEPDDVLDVVTAHDWWCAIYGSECCNCAPRIVIQTIGGEIRIDEDGDLVTGKMN